MSGELWQIVNDYEPSEKDLLWLANIQQAIQENLNEVYGSNISYPHFLERKDDFHDGLRKTIRKVVDNSERFGTNTG